MAAYQALQSQVLWAAFAASLGFGAIVQRTNFCTMGALSDIYNMGSWARMRMWVMAVGVTLESSTASATAPCWRAWASTEPLCTCA